MKKLSAICLTIIIAIMGCCFVGCSDKSEQEEYKYQLHQHLQQRISQIQQPKQQTIFSLLSSLISIDSIEKEIIRNEKKEIFKEILILMNQDDTMMAERM